jgi:hypothetical protein
VPLTAPWDGGPAENNSPGTISISFQMDVERYARISYNYILPYRLKISNRVESANDPENGKIQRRTGEINGKRQE